MLLRSYLPEMIDFKKQAAIAAIQFIKPNMIIGVGMGSTINHLIDAVAADTKLAQTLSFVAACNQTETVIRSHGLQLNATGDYKEIDLYFDGCDQLDRQLNALKSGGGIHVSEKVLATMADEFILLADAGKFVPALNNVYPLVLEALPFSVPAIINKIQKRYPDSVFSIRTYDATPVLTERNNLLVDVKFRQLPLLKELNSLKMIPGVVDHSLFYKIAKKAVIAGPEGVQVISAL